MALIPKRTKFRKYFKGKIRNKIYNANLNFGVMGLQAMEAGRLTPKQIESARRVIKKKIKAAKGLVKIKVKTYLLTSSKPLASRMGRGKGKSDIYVCPVKSGTILYEISCLNHKLAKNALVLASYKLPIRNKIIYKKSTFAQ